MNIHSVVLAHTVTGALYAAQTEGFSGPIIAASDEIHESEVFDLLVDGFDSSESQVEWINRCRPQFVVHSYECDGHVFRVS